MSRLPSPFDTNLPTFMTPQNSPNNRSPGFLMMTRPPSASSDQAGRNKYVNRGNPRLNYHSFGQNRYSNRSPTGIRPMRNQANYYNRSPYAMNQSPRQPVCSNPRSPYQQFRTPSPNASYSSQWKSPSDHSSQYNSPNSFNSRYNRGSPYQKKHATKGKHDTPLKSIPIDKFISYNMTKDPWEGLEDKFWQQATLTDYEEDGASAIESNSIRTGSPLSDRVSDNSDIGSDA